MLDLTAIKARRENEYRPGIVYFKALRDIDALLLEVERLTKENKQLITYALEYAYDKGEDYAYCNGCDSDGSMHLANCPVDFIERISGRED